MSSQQEVLNHIQNKVTTLKQAVADTRSLCSLWLAAAERRSRERIAAAVSSHDTVVKDARAQEAASRSRATEQNTQRRDAIISEYSAARASARTAYQTVLSQVDGQAQQVTTEAGFLAAPWDDAAWVDWRPAREGPMPPYVSVGQMVDAGTWDKLRLPALVPLAGGRPLCFEATGGARSMVVEGMQSILLRLLAALPPGKLRFTFIDPVGLGQNVAPFMHLADYDDALVTGKAWTEPQHIQQRLVDLTEHIENVIQKYLRNQYTTIEDYNAHAGEVAEAYRLLVVMDFPTAFSEDAARRLMSIAQNGPRCGVYTVVLVDTAKPMPYGFTLADLEQSATVIRGAAEQFAWDDEDFRNCTLHLDRAPDVALFNKIVQTSGEVAKESARVEVPFDRIAPQRSEWWKADASEGLHIPLGPAGARKIQSVDLGKGTAQHVLVAGKTGSGKSTLLHTLIAGVALSYSPDEVELYLIDFKKGVEFKTYAAHQLPHARVVAIESEREFGLSVLSGLDEELKRRGAEFRAAGVDHVSDYRDKTAKVMPRLVLLVDEFQEFFTEDDHVATQASQILDRLVRQGRAFGIHVLLGSQTLAGAYSLARSTVDQMAVRIALQCSEADSRLILADDNPAARLLSRPGEAIYNAANGMVEGNNRFQVAWLPDSQRDQYLDHVSALAKERGYQGSQIVFEGNAPAAVEKNQPLTEAIAAAVWPAAARSLNIWLGDPVAIREPVSAVFRRQSGSNLLMVGQSDEAALGMMAVALASAAAQFPPRTDGEIGAAGQMFVLDFGAVEGPLAGFFTHMAGILPSPIRIVRRRDLAETMGLVTTEVQRRLEADTPGSPPILVFLYGLQRARDLRQDEAFGLGSFGQDASAPSLSQQFATILRDGPDVGVHTLLWCDTMTNLGRSLDRRALREFAMRVAFQMSAEDSSNLIDTPAANKLGQYRALFYSEEEARLEKLRPYGLPSDEWLAWVGDRLKAKRLP